MELIVIWSFSCILTHVCTCVWVSKQIACPNLQKSVIYTLLNFTDLTLLQFIYNTRKVVFLGLNLKILENVCTFGYKVMMISTMLQNQKIAKCSTKSKTSWERKNTLLQQQIFPSMIFIFMTKMHFVNLVIFQTRMQWRQVTTH